MSIFQGVCQFLHQGLKSGLRKPPRGTEKGILFLHRQDFFHQQMVFKKTYSTNIDQSFWIRLDSLIRSATKSMEQVGANRDKFFYFFAAFGACFIEENFVSFGISFHFSISYERTNPSYAGLLGQLFFTD